MTYRELVEHDPRIANVMAGLRSSPNGWWKYEQIKRRLYPLVGFAASVPELANAEAYSCAVQEAARRLGL